MEKFINNRFCDNTDGSSYPYLHRRLILNTLKYLWSHTKTAIINYNEFNEKIEGEYKEWYENGQLSKQSIYVNGKHHGGYKSWFRNDKLQMQCTYVDGKREGKYEYYYDCGQLWIQCTYIN